MAKNAVILLIRHAEKPLEGRGLSPQGERRAHAYIDYFTSYHVGPNRTGVDALFACADTENSARPRLTLQPLAEARGLPLNTDFADKETERLAKKLLGDKYDDKVVLVCWKHGEILRLAAALGATSTSLPERSRWPAEWPDEEFRWVLQISYDASGDLDPGATYCIREPAIAV